MFLLDSHQPRSPASRAKVMIWVHRSSSTPSASRMRMTSSWSATWPFSRREICALLWPMRLASCSWVSPASMRSFLSSLASRCRRTYGLIIPPLGHRPGSYSTRSRARRGSKRTLSREVVRSRTAFARRNDTYVVGRFPTLHPRQTPKRSRRRTNLDGRSVRGRYIESGVNRRSLLGEGGEESDQALRRRHPQRTVPSRAGGGACPAGARHGRWLRQR